MIKHEQARVFHACRIVRPARLPRVIIASFICFRQPRFPLAHAINGVNNVNTPQSPACLFSTLVIKPVYVHCVESYSGRQARFVG